MRRVQQVVHQVDSATQASPQSPVDSQGVGPQPGIDVGGVRGAVHTALQREPGAALQYGSTEGYEPLRRDMAVRIGAGVSFQDVGITTGHDQSVDLLAKSLIDPGDAVIVDAGATPEIRARLASFGARVIEAPADANGMRSDALDTLVREHKPKFVYVLPDNGGAAGETVMTGQRRQEMIHLSREHGVQMVEAYPANRLTIDAARPDVPSLMELGSGTDAIVQCGTLEVAGSGCGVGWLATRPNQAELLRKTMTCKQYADANTGTLIQVVAHRLIEKYGQCAETHAPPAAGQPVPQSPIAFSARAERLNPSAIRELFKMLADPELISFAGGFPDAELFDVEGILQACDEVLDECQLEGMEAVGPEGLPELRERLATFMTDVRRAGEVSADDILPTTGSQQAIDLLGRMLGPGDTVIVEGPTFLATFPTFALNGAKVVVAPTDREGVQPDELRRLMELHKPKLVYTIPTYGNPTGATLTHERRIEVLKLAAEFGETCGTITIEDDPYGLLDHGTKPPPTMLELAKRHVPQSEAHLVHLFSLSKVACPGLRVGGMVAPPAVLRQATQLKFSATECNTFTQAVAAKYLASGRMEAHLEKVRRVYAERAQTMCSELKRQLGDSIRIEADPEGGLFVFARLPGLNAMEVSRAAAANGVGFVPGKHFYAQGGDKSSLRLSFATCDVNRIRSGVKILADVVHLAQAYAERTAAGSRDETPPAQLKSAM